MSRSLSSILVLSLLLAGCNAEPAWKPLSLPADNVRVQMPGTWKEQKDADGQRIYQAIHGRTEYLLGVADVPNANVSPDQARQVLRMVRDEMVKKLPGGKIVSESDTEVEGRPGIAFEAKGTNQETAKARLFFTDRSLVTVMVDYQNSPSSQANVDKYLNSLTFNLNAPAATTPGGSPPAPAPVPTPAPVAAAISKSGEDKRNAWRYTNAPQIFPDQHGYNGVIRKTNGNVWIDDTEKGPLEFIEDVRTPEYVELKRPVGDFRVRLYDGHSEYKFGYSPKWEQMFPGKWE